MKKLIALIVGIISVNISFGLCRQVTVTNAGTLSNELGNDQLSVDSLIVNGPINAEDFKTMWAASFYGNLSYIDIADADVENKTIPTRAFLDASAQTDENKVLIPIKLRKIVLPDDVETIAFQAFYNAVYLEEINLPQSLKNLGPTSFANCKSLSVSPLIIPDGMTYIPGDCFHWCTSLNQVILPPGINMIDDCAFADSSVKYINLPEKLFNISWWAFRNSGLKEIVIPENCEYIKSGAFDKCKDMEIMVLPSTLRYLESYTCANLKSLKALYSKASKPPYCIQDALFGELAFGHVDSIPGENSTPKNIPVYVPVGSAELYRNASGWNYFTNFIETNDFPTSGIEGIKPDTPATINTIYDLSGRQVANPMPGMVYIINGKKALYSL